MGRGPLISGPAGEPAQVTAGARKREGAAGVAAMPAAMARVEAAEAEAKAVHYRSR